LQAAQREANPSRRQQRLLETQTWYQRNLPAYQPGGAHSPYAVKEVPRSVEFHGAADMKIRLAELPPQFDDKGVLKPRTQSELAKAKGKDPRLAGYEGTKEDLTTGALVRVTLARVSAAPKKDKEKASLDSATQHKMQVTQVLVLSKDGTAPE